MFTNIRALVLGAVVAIGAAVLNTNLASAQATPSPAPKPKATVAPSPTPTPAPTASPTPYQLFTVQGSADLGFTAVGGSDQARFTTGIPSRVFDGSTGSFVDANSGHQLAGTNDFVNAPDIQNVNVSVTANGPFISGKVEGSFGTDANVIASNGQPRQDWNLTQAYAQAARGNWTLIAGKFETLAGAELIEAPGDSNYSRSYLFGYAIPFTHTGARLSYVINPKFTVVAGANNGWDDWKFVGKKKTLEGALLMTLSPAVAWTVQTYNGNDFAVNGSPAIGQPGIFTNRMLYDSVLTVKATPALTLIGNYDNGTQLADSGTFFPATAHWNGFAGYANYQVSPQWGVSLRKETFHDIAGFRTGVAQRLQSNTATINYTPTSNLQFRGEYRIDATDANDFTYRGYVPTILAPFDGRAHQPSIGIETIVKFP
jgi:hypothetical protein